VIRRRARASASESATTWHLVYDDTCAACQVATAAVVLADRRARLSVCGLTAPESDVLLTAVPGDLRPRSVHLVAPDGRVLSAGAAVVQLCRLVPGLGGLGRLGGAAPDVAERVYAWTVRRRDGVSGHLPGALSRRARMIIRRRARTG
jgi:predicted DCC family thiol-disulfide oxidoreductase YuxK